MKMVLRGPESIAAAEQLRQEVRAKSQWPYPWVYPPPGAIRIDAGLNASGTIAVPAVATPTAGLTFKVDEGFLFAPVGIVVEYINDGVHGTPNPGDFTWSLTRNKPVGVSTFQGSPVQGFTDVDVPIGTLQIPWPVGGGDIYISNDILRIVITNVNLSTGPPNYIKSVLRGWLWPAS